MAIITLISDMGITDYYVAAVKGTILSQLPTATIIDISHQIRPYNIAQAGFVLRNCYKCFPKGTIHIIAVNTIESAEEPHVAVKADGHYFISTDNGIFSHFLDNGFEEAVSIDVPQDADSYTFCERDRFAKVAVMLANGEPLSAIGTPRANLNVGGSFKPAYYNDSINGMVMHVDSYGNAITNISQKMFEENRAGRNFIISFGNSYEIDTISDSYDDVATPNLVAVFGSHGFLEVALRQANISSLCGLDINSTIRVKFL